MTSIFETGSPQHLYFLASAGVAVLTWWAGQMLKRNAGKLPSSPVFHFSSLLDTLWFFVSLLVWYFVDLTPLQTSVPVVYGLYSIFGWIYGTRLLSREGIPDAPEDLVIPTAYIEYSQSFAVIFFGLCLGVLAHSLLFAV